MKPVDIKSKAYISFDKENSYVSWTYSIKDLNEEEIIGTFCKKQLQKRN